MANNTCSKWRWCLSTMLVLVVITASIPLRVEGQSLSLVDIATPEFLRGETRPKSVALFLAGPDEIFRKWTGYYVAELLRTKGYPTKVLNAHQINADPQLLELTQRTAKSIDEQQKIFRPGRWGKPKKLKQRKLHVGTPANLLASKLEVDGLVFAQVMFIRTGNVSVCTLALYVVNGKTGDIEAYFADQVQSWQSRSDAMATVAQKLREGVPAATQVIEAKGSTLQAGAESPKAKGASIRELGVQIDSLHDAATWGDLDQLKGLIAKGTDINARDKEGNTPLMLAASTGHKAIADLLVAEGARIDAKNNKRNTALHGAAAAGHTTVADLLIAKGAEINGKNEGGDTPLMLAALTGYRGVAELLIAKGADINASKEDGHTPLYIASLHGNTEVADLLIAKGAEVNARNKSGNTPLAAAAAAGNRDVARLLIAKGADINAKTEYGNTPLHWAATTGRWAVTELLIVEGADVNAKNENGETPRGVADLKGHKNVAKLLKQHGGKKK